jgi:DsbC/DsbD-like thiol-disulfide interchange protein
LRKAGRSAEVCVVRIRSITRIDLARDCARGTKAIVAIILAATFAIPVACAAGVPVEVTADDVFARVTISASHARGGDQLGVAAEITVAPGWHIYGLPLPDGDGLTPTSIVFDPDVLASQSIRMPAPTPLKFPALNVTYPVYTGVIKAAGHLTLKPQLKPGDYRIAGTLNFQECNDSMCKMPQALRFELPIQISP